ncbi:MliC family protein [Shewanella subflava]|uniref:MliC family protein n=1 Tax=Shewanella subflava TaxID=2986476 RepID=A0ABT3I710_9GAMM|nr:MliC family protein [Shewanella subflava]MCW3171847.1 MliC family protein [Shewanella subflava]
MKNLWILSLSGLGLSFSVIASSPSPSFNCNKAQGSIEELICQSEELSQLDTQLQPLYSQAIKQLNLNDAKILTAEQRGWIKGRNDCWKADDKTECTRVSYQTRITELQISAASINVPSPTYYQCNNESALQLSAYFYNDTLIPAVVFSYHTAHQPPSEPAIGFITRTASGAKYQAQHASLWTHQQEATLTFFGQPPITCTMSK